MRILLLLASITYACQVEYRSTQATLNEFLNVVITDHLNETYAIDPSIALEKYPIGFKECLTLNNVTGKINSTLKPLGFKGKWVSGIFQITKIDLKEKQESKKYYETYTIPNINPSLVELNDVNMSLDTLNGLVTIYGEKKRHEALIKYLKKLPYSRQFQIEFEITEVISTNKDSRGFDLTGFFLNSTLQYNDAQISPITQLSYISDSLGLKLNVTQKPSFKIMTNKPSTFFTGLQIENLVTTSNEQQLVTETRFREVGLSIKSLLKTINQELYFDLDIINEEQINDGISKTQLNSLVKVRLKKWNVLVGETRTRIQEQNRSYPILKYIPFIGKYFTYKSTEQLDKQIIYTYKITEVL